MAGPPVVHALAELKHLLEHQQTYLILCFKPKEHPNSNYALILIMAISG